MSYTPSTTNDSIICAQLIVTGENANPDVPEPGEMRIPITQTTVLAPSGLVVSTTNTSAVYNNSTVVIKKAINIKMPAVTFASQQGFVVDIVSAVNGAFFIEPIAGTKFNYAGATNGKKISNTSAAVGDYVRFGVFSAVQWQILDMHGIWVVES